VHLHCGLVFPGLVVHLGPGLGLAGNLGKGCKEGCRLVGGLLHHLADEAVPGPGVLPP
jgi:hypothetical protein